MGKFYVEVRTLLLEGVMLIPIRPRNEMQKVRELGAVLAAFHPEKREAIFLNVVEGYTTREISELMTAPYFRYFEL